MNLITELLDDPGFVAGFRERSDPLSLGQVLPLLGIEPTAPDHWVELRAEGFEPAEPELLDQALLARFPVSALPVPGAGPPPPEEEHGPGLWLEGRYLDPGHREIAVFPNEDDPATPRVMLFAPGELGEDGVVLDVASAEVEVMEGSRRLLGVVKRHQRCPKGFRQQDGKFHCPAGGCPKGVCVDWTWDEPIGVKHECVCDHGP